MFVLLLGDVMLETLRLGRSEHCMAFVVGTFRGYDSPYHILDGWRVSVSMRRISIHIAIVISKHVLLKRRTE